MAETAVTTLVILPRFPNQRTGSGQRSRLLVDGAVEAGSTHVILVDGASNTRSASELPGVASLSSLFSEHVTPQGAIAKRLGGGMRLLAPRSAYAPDPKLRAALLEHIKRHDIDTVIFRYTHIFCAAGITPADGVRVIVDVDDRDDQKYQTRLTRMFGARLAGTWLGRIPINRLSNVMKSRLSQANHVWFATQEDVWTLGAAQVSLLPNVAFATPPQNVPAPSTCDQTILFVGIFNHLPNRDGIAWFLESCWATVVSRCPEARLRVVGRGNWASMSEQFPKIKNVEFVGVVADLAPEYAKARLTICPVREGGGSKIKVLEAASFGRPVVATSHSLRGFGGLDRVALCEADDPDAFANGCTRILESPQIADQEGAALRNWQLANYFKRAFLNKVTQALKPD